MVHHRPQRQTKRTTVILTQKERDILRKIQEQYGMSISQAIRVALARYMELMDTATALVSNTLAHELAGKGKNPRNNHH